MMSVGVEMTSYLDMTLGIQKIGGCGTERGGGGRRRTYNLMM